MILDEISQKQVMKVWRTNPFQIFTWETVKIIASNPKVKNAKELEGILTKIIVNRMNK